MLGEQVLNSEVVEELTLSESQNLKSLYTRHKPSSNPESLLCNLLATLVNVRVFSEPSVEFLLPKAFDLEKPRFSRERSHIVT